MPPPSLLALIALAGVLVGLLAGLASLRGLLLRRAGSLAAAWEAERVQEATTNALVRSRAVLRGQLVEHLVPVFDAEAFANPGDARFLGKPVDFIVFDGYEDVRAGRAERLREIVFVDVKTGTSRLSGVERSIRDCVEAGRVRAITLTRPNGGSSGGSSAGSRLR